MTEHALRFKTPHPITALIAEVQSH